MNVLLTHGYFLHDDAKEMLIMRPYVPLGILYISAYLEQNAVDNEVFDSTFSSFPLLKIRLLQNPPTYLLVYVNLMTKVNVLKIIHFVKSTPALMQSIVILGGPEVKNHTSNFLNYGADYIVIGEGEETTLALIKQLESGQQEGVFLIGGLCYKNKDGHVIYTAERPKIKDIDTLPFPNRKKVNLHNYLDAWKSHHGKNTISVSTMRGCPYSCKWCSRAVYGMSYRRRSAKIVVAELIEIKAVYNPDSLWFVDDVFTINHKWLREFVDELIIQNVCIPFECITRADRLNAEVMQLLQSAGCFRVWIGAESGSQKIIDAMDRRVDVTTVRQMIQLAKQYNIEAGTFIMLGYPGETEQDIEETIHHLKSANPDYFTITVAYPIKGTELYQEVESQFMQQLNWETSTDRDIDFKRTYPRRYYDYAVRHVVNEVNYYKRRHANQLFTLETAKCKTKSVVAKIGMWWIRTVKAA